MDGPEKLHVNQRIASSMKALSIFKSVARSSLLCMSMTLANSALSQAPQSGRDLPDLYGMRLDGVRVTIDVLSYGLTSASDFTVDLTPTSTGTYDLSIIRHRKDRGRVAPHIIAITLEIPAIPNLAQAKFHLSNKLATTGDPSDPRALLRSDP